MEVSESPHITACEDAERKGNNVGRAPSASEGEPDCADANAGGAFGFNSWRSHAAVPALSRPSEDPQQPDGNLKVTHSARVC